MADEETALVADDGAQVEEPVAEQLDDTPEPIANLARDLGWAPREEWHGEPDKWKPAEQFIRDGRDMQQSATRELKGLREQMGQMANITQRLVADKEAERDAYWQTKFDEAVDAGDRDTAKQIAEQMRREPEQREVPSETRDWIARNPWFNSDPLAKALAVQVTQINASLPVSDQLAEAEAAVKKRFPEYFAQAKAPPATQTAGTRTAAPSNRVKGYNEMPAEYRQAALEWERTGGPKKEAFARSYWAEQEGVKR